MTYEDRLKNMWSFDLDAQLYSSLLIIAILLVLTIVVGIQARHVYKKKLYLERPRGGYMIAEWGVEKLGNWVETTMGPGWENMTGYFLALTVYLFIAFNWGLTGMPSVIDWLPGPLCLSIIMFVMIQSCALRYNHWHYFHRYIEPIALFLPINLITMWTPIISTAMRMFGNCLSGSIIIGLVQWALGKASMAIFSSVVPLTGTYTWTSIFLAPIPMGILNLYFSLFSGFVQTLVFCTLSALWIAQERPEGVAPSLVDSPRASLAKE
jgi:F-type H+-transporting ATPase subunit a